MPCCNILLGIYERRTTKAFFTEKTKVSPQWEAKGTSTLIPESMYWSDFVTKPSLFPNVSSSTLRLIKRLANPKQTLKAGLLFPPIRTLYISKRFRLIGSLLGCRISLEHDMRHTTRSSERVGFGQERTPESQAKLDAGAVELHRSFRHVFSGQHSYLFLTRCYLGHGFKTSFKCEVGLSYQRGQRTNLG